MSTYYEIQVKGQLDPRWSEWFDCGHLHIRSRPVVSDGAKASTGVNLNWNFVGLSFHEGW
jgi:hypothetical protein